MKLLPLLLILVNGYRILLNSNTKLNSARHLLNKSASTAASMHIRLKNEDDINYLGSIHIGTPAQKINNLLYDTGSNDMWVFGDESKKWISGASFFDEKASKSFKDQGDIFVEKYVTGFAMGSIVQDDLHIGDSATKGIFPAHHFGLVKIFSECLSLKREECLSKDCAWDKEEKCSDKKYPVQQEGMNGIIGLGYSEARSRSQGVLVYDGSLFERFSFYLTGSGRKGSMLIVGEPDKSLFSEPWIRVPLQESTAINFPDWTILVTDIRVEKSAVGLTSPVYATVDTGSSAMGVDNTFWEEQLKPLIDKESCKEIGNRAQCRTKLLEITFLVNDVSGVQKELMLQDKGTDDEVLDFYPVDGIYEETGIHLILGVQILQKFYTEFNYRDRQINFALRKKEKGNHVFWISLIAGIVCVLALAGYGWYRFINRGRSAVVEDDAEPGSVPLTETGERLGSIPQSMPPCIIDSEGRKETVTKDSIVDKIAPVATESPTIPAWDMNNVQSAETSNTGECKGEVTHGGHSDSNAEPSSRGELHTFREKLLQKN